MAAALLKRLWAEAGAPWELRVESAGTHAFPGLNASEHAIAAMRERGIDLNEHRSQAVTDETLRSADLILTMTGRHNDYIRTLWPDRANSVYTLGEFAGGSRDVPDPFGGPLKEYQSTAAALEQTLRAVIERIKREGAS